MCIRDRFVPGSESASAQIPVAESPSGVAVNPYSKRVYVALSNGTVDVIDGRKNRIVKTVTVGGDNAGIAVNATTGYVFFTDNSFGIATVGILGSSGTLLANVALGNTPYGVDVDLVTNLAFVTNAQDHTVSVIDGKTNAVRGVLAVTGLSIAANPSTGKVYVGGQDNSITVISEK